MSTPNESDPQPKLRKPQPAPVSPAPRTPTPTTSPQDGPAQQSRPAPNRKPLTTANLHREADIIKEHLGVEVGQKPLLSVITDFMVDRMLTGKPVKPPKPKTQAAQRRDKLRDMCRKGNPFPLLAEQWPELVIWDRAEAKFFESRIVNGELLEGGEWISKEEYDANLAADPNYAHLNPCIRIDYWQRQIIASFFDEAVAEIGIKGNTKAGKGFAVSLAINLWYDVWDQTKVILTSQSFEHACSTLYAEAYKWRLKMAAPSSDKANREGFWGNKQRNLRILNPLTGEGFSGQHGPRTLFVFDEATSVSDHRYDDAQKQARKIVALANPRTLSGWFRNLYKPCADPNKTQIVNGVFGRRLCVTVDGADCMNAREKRLEKPLGPPGGIVIKDRDEHGVEHEFTYQHNEDIPPHHFALVQPLIPEQCDYGRFMGICQHPDPRHVDVFAHGKFPTEDLQRQLILGSWLEFHESAWRRLLNAKQLPKVDAFGLDVARSLDGDFTVLSAGGQDGVHGFHKWRYADVAFHATEVMRIAWELYGIDLREGRVPVCVDMDGLGAGAGDVLRSYGVWVIEFRGNASSQVDPRVYANLRAEAYGTLGARLNPDGRWGGVPWAMPEDQDLRLGLCAPEKMYSADGLRFGISPKTRQHGMSEKTITVKEKMDGKSPDTADSCVYLFHAVRELHQLNELFRGYSGPLVMYPMAEGGDEAKRMEEAVGKEEMRELLKGGTMVDVNRDALWRALGVKKEGEKDATKDTATGDSTFPQDAAQPAPTTAPASTLPPRPEQSAEAADLLAFLRRDRGGGGGVGREVESYQDGGGSVVIGGRRYAGLFED